MARKLTYTVVLEPQPEGGFTVLVPALPEVVTEGDTEEEALRMAIEAIELALDYRRDKGLDIPKDAAPRAVSDRSESIGRLS
ncbi:MAG TPA: type II toxin-antitoxin system HicB family antitoxin [Alphaproteobacteria bacterium]